MYINKTFSLDQPISKSGESDSLSLINTLPDEILVEIFSYMRLAGLTRCALTCKRWNRITTDSKVMPPQISAAVEALLPALEQNNRYIGPETVRSCLGEIGQIPPFTKELLKELESNDPRHLNKKKKETHILALIPKKINGHPLTLNALNAHKAFRFYWSKIKGEYGDCPYPKTAWVLMTKDLLKESRGKRNDKLLQMASDYGEGYRAPTLLEAAFINTLLFESKNIRLFGDAPYTYTCCQSNRPLDIPLAVGGFGSLGLEVHSLYGYNYVGVAALKTF